MRALILCALIAGASCKKPSRPGLTMTITSDGAVIRVGDELPASTIFDGDTVSLRGVRGETLGVIVAFREPPPEPPTLAIEGVEVASYSIEMVPVTEASSALFGPSRGAGLYPDRVVPLTKSRQYLFDIAIRDGKGGRRGELTAGDRTIAVELEVVPVAIRLDRSPLLWVWYLAAELARAHDVAADGGPAQIALELRYRQLFLAHGALLATDPAPAELESRRPLILESALYWPVRLRSRDTDKLARDARTVIDFFAPLPQTPFTIPIDEPASDEARLAVVANGKVLRGAGAGEGALLHTVTDRERPVYGDWVDVFISPHLGAERTRHRWTYNGRPPRATSLIVDGDGGSLRSWGWIAFRYDVELWYAWEGLYWTDRYNKGDAPTDFSTSMVSFDERRRGGEDHGNGDGVLAYPGGIASLRLKALRRGLQDRLLLQKLVACGGREEAAAITAATIPAALGEARGVALWPRSEAGWERARAAVLDAIAERCPPE